MNLEEYHLNRVISTIRSLPEIGWFWAIILPISWIIIIGLFISTPYNNIRLLIEGKNISTRVIYFNIKSGYYGADAHYVEHVKLQVEGINYLVKTSHRDLKKGDIINVRHSPKGGYALHFSGQYNWLKVFKNSHGTTPIMNTIVCFFDFIILLYGIIYLLNSNYLVAFWITKDSYQNSLLKSETQNGSENRYSLLVMRIIAIKDCIKALSVVPIIVILGLVLIKAVYTIGYLEPFSSGLLITPTILIITFLPSKVFRSLYNLRNLKNPLFNLIRETFQLGIGIYSSYKLWKFLGRDFSQTQNFSNLFSDLLKYIF